MTRTQIINHYKRMISLRYEQIIEHIESKGYYTIGITRKDIAKTLTRFIENTYSLKCSIAHNGYGNTDIIVKRL
jgi:hypothetical protein